MMQKFLLAAALMVGMCAAGAIANYDGTQGTGTHFVAFDATHSGTSLCAAANTQCVSFVVINSAGTEMGTVSNPFQVTVANTNANGQATMANSSPVVISSNQSSVPVTPLSTTNAGATTVKGGVGVVNGGSFYQAVAASQTATVLQSSTGAIGDYLSHCVLYPTSTSPGVVTVFDNTNAAAGSAILFPGGATSLSNLAPISIPVGAVSTAGAWKVTTGTAISVVCYGKFS